MISAAQGRQQRRRPSFFVTEIMDRPDKPAMTSKRRGAILAGMDLRRSPFRAGD
jgi:hypothetical protein